jgi:hypothetical protein
MTDSATYVQPNPQEAQPQGSAAVDYFGFQHTEKFYLPDGVSYFELQALNEGQKAKFQKRTQRDMILEKGSGNAKFRIDPSTERHELIMAATVGWNLTRGGQPIQFGDRSIRDFLELANPKIVESIEAKIRKMNPWLLSDMSVEEIDEQIKELEDMRKVAVEREAGEASSSNR